MDSIQQGNHVTQSDNYDRLAIDIETVIENVFREDVFREYWKPPTNDWELYLQEFVKENLPLGIIALFDSIVELVENWIKQNGSFPRFSVVVDTLQKIGTRTENNTEFPKELFLQLLELISSKFDSELQEFEMGQTFIQTWKSKEPSLRLEYVKNMLESMNIFQFLQTVIQDDKCTHSEIGRMIDQVNSITTGSDSLVVDDSFPNQAEYYVQRRLTTSKMIHGRTIDSDAFKASSGHADVFFIKGIQWSQLSKLAHENGRTSVRSGSQIDTETKQTK